jgi:hypothetical protein
MRAQPLGKNMPVISLVAYFVRSSLRSPSTFSQLAATLRSPHCERPPGRSQGCQPRCASGAHLGRGIRARR